MKAGYKVEGRVFICDNFIRVNNYPESNTVVNRGFISEKAIVLTRFSKTIGIWRIKRK